MPYLIFGQLRICVVGDVVARHLEVGRAHVVKTLFASKALGHGAADTRITAARKDKVDILIAFKRSLADQLTDKRRDLADIYRNAYDERLFGSDGRIVLFPDPLKKIDGAVVQPVCEFFSYESGVARCTEIEDHKYLPVLFMMSRYSKLRIAATDVIINNRCLIRRCAVMENKENNNTFKKSVLLLSVALIIAIVAVIILGIAVIKNTSNDRKLSERVKEVELMSAKNAKDIQYVLYLGTNDKDTNLPVYSKEEAKKVAEEILLRHFGGYTIQEAEGGWKDNDKVYQEYTLVIYLSDTTMGSVHKAADELIEKFHQSSILIQSNKTTTEFYSK